jgi:hypothetical protein
VDVTSGKMPLSQPQRRNLMEVLRKAPDPRGSNTRFRTGPVLCIVAMALLCGARQISEIARFATRLRPQQRRELGLPRKKGTKAFYEAPGYGVFYQLLTRMDPAAFADILTGWLSEQQGALPGALALDGKMIRDIIGTVSLVDVEDGSPVAVAVMDQKEGTNRCELKVAQDLLRSLPSLEGKTITADPLHCQKDTARAIVDKGGDYFLQIKGNQPSLLELARIRPEESPICPDLLRARARGNPRGQLRHSRTPFHRVPLQPHYPQNPQHKAHQENRSPKPGGPLLSFQPTLERPHPGKLDQPEPLPLGWSRKPQPLPPRRIPRRRCHPLPQSQCARQPRPPAQRLSASPLPRRISRAVAAGKEGKSRRRSILRKIPHLPPLMISKQKALMAGFAHGGGFDRVEKCGKVTAKLTPPCLPQNTF